MSKMIQLAIISDIHGNIHALDRVLEDIEQRQISTIYCLGDLVDFAPWGNEVIARIQALKIPCILGNHDERIAFDLPIVPLTHHSENETQNRFIAINQSKKSISAPHKKWLSELPFHIELTYKIQDKSFRILLVHAEISSNDTYVYETDSKSELVDELKARHTDAIIMGHTHQSYIQRIDEVLLVNSGSVGRSREADRKASYTILSISESGIEAEIIKVDYDRAYVAQEIYRSEIPDFYADFILNQVPSV